LMKSNWGNEKIADESERHVETLQTAILVPSIGVLFV
jgi:hypothetical protein